MSRRTYHLSDQTIKVINGHATDVAEEFGCDPSYIHGILSENQTDPFAKFEWLFASAVKAGCDVGPWVHRLKVIRAKYHGLEPSCVKTETAKSVKEFNDIVIASIEGKPLEAQLIEIDQASAQLDILRKATISQIAAGENGNGVREFARAKVRARG